MTRRDIAELLFLSAVWGASFILIEITGHSFPPAWVALLRLTFGGALLWAVLLLRRRTLPPRRMIVPLLLVALFNNAIPFCLFALGERTVPSGIAAVLNATTPICALLLSFAVQSMRPARATIAGVLLGFAGVVIVVLSHEGAAHNTASSVQFYLGVLFIAIGSLGYAIATVIAKSRLQGLDPIGLATTQLSLAWLMILPVALFGPHPTEIHPSSIVSAIALGFAGSGIAYLLYYDLLSRISSTHVVAVTYLLPVWGLFWGYVAHEPILWTAYLGVLIVIAGLALMNLSLRTVPATKTPPMEDCVTCDAS
ncbi:MAG: DMT family transporter [Edaphobacter sp.]|uniref:DMT family transporter n=1 Tax=Edaphobacter sp. TaxID=1934404 RepID=UPI00238287A8|nr:DMT family transporter [Edaphobacter sp.]MDE1176625.1 DMT family transporter [Edaphobacter sp.]